MQFYFRQFMPGRNEKAIKMLAFLICISPPSLYNKIIGCQKRIVALIEAAFDKTEKMQARRMNKVSFGGPVSSNPQMFSANRPVLMALSIFRNS